MSDKDKTDLLMVGLLGFVIYLMVRSSRAAQRPDHSGFTVPSYEQYAVPDDASGSDGNEDGCC